MAKNEDLLFLLKERNYDPTLFQKEKEPNNKSDIVSAELKESNGERPGWRKNIGWKKAIITF